MIKKIFIFIILLVLFLSGYYFGFLNGKSKAVNEYIDFYANSGIFKSDIEQEISNEFETDDVLGKINYPLIDIYFNLDDNWNVIIRTNLFSESEKFFILRDALILHFNTAKIRVLTFPAGRGTTPEGVLYVYKGKELIREVQFFEIYIDDTAIENEFIQLPKEVIESTIRAKLPSPI
ncbi:MAG: hypothetical protein FWD28_07560 [Treponema sp.]|nr:hypothetical protein [Treponema sp.]